MHTLAKNKGHNTRLITDFIENAYPEGLPSIEQLIEDNIINGTQLIEQAVSKVEGIGLCEIGDHRDLVDDSDVKTTTVGKVTNTIKSVLKDGTRKRYKSTIYTCQIADINKKWGVLRIICWNPFHGTDGKYQFFLVPPSAVFGCKHLRISFDARTFEPSGKYARYEVPDFTGIGKKLSVRDVIDTLVCNVNKENIIEQITKILNFIPNAEDAVDFEAADNVINITTGKKQTETTSDSFEYKARRYS